MECRWYSTVFESARWGGETFPVCVAALTCGRSPLDGRKEWRDTHIDTEGAAAHGFDLALEGVRAATKARSRSDPSLVPP